jgi:LPXTG-motif cell wall-anchored protein
MSTTNPMTGKVSQNYGWIHLFLVASIQTLTILLLAVFSGPDTFQADTGIAWTELSSAYPSVATQFSMAQQSSLVTTLAVGLFSLAVTYFAFRSGQRWAWFAMWILPASMILGNVSLAQTENQAGIAVLVGAFILLAVAGLLLSYRKFFQKQA